MSSKAKYYTVWKGRRAGVFASWEECEAQVKGYTGAQYKGFATRQAAERALRGDYRAYAGKPASSGDWLFAPQSPIADSLAVDAACSGSPGRLEWCGVYTSTGKVIFRKGPFANGTNNVGEFLAIVDALAWLKMHADTRSVYSDSTNAILWVKAGKCRTSLRQDHANARLFELIPRAEAWLAENPAHNPVLKWDTEAWGEIPADFNRK